MKYNTKLTIKIYLKHTMAYKWLVLFVFVSLAIGDTFAVLAPYWYKKFFDLLGSNPGVSTLYSVLLVIFGIKLLHWLFIRLMDFAYIRLSTNTLRDLANTCFTNLHKHSFSFFNNNFVGSLVKKVNRFSQSFDRIADRVVWDFIPTVLNITLICIVLSFRNKLLAVIILVWVLIYVISSYFFSKFKLKYDYKRSQIDSEATALLADSVTNNSNVKLMVGYQRECNSFANKNEELTRIRVFSWNIANLFEGFQWLLMILLEMVIIVYAIKLWSDGQLTIGDFVLIQAYLVMIIQKLWGFGRIIRDFYESLADAEEMTEIFDTPFEIKDVKNAKELKVVRGEIKFLDVNFAYNKTRSVIKKINLNIKSSEKIALVGPSGAGKSTIVKLLLRQHNVSSGKILVDGQDIAKVTQESLWHNVSLVPQDPILFHRSIIENIRYAKPEATDEEVIVAAKLANAHDFILEAPQGYNTFVGERGIKLSGGERQRIAIARAILKNSPILVLDEATSSLDSKSEKLIQEALVNLMKGKTVIIIAHRLSTIMHSDRILVIKDGEVVEQGQHKELLKNKKGIYNNLWDIQVGGFLA